MSDLRNQPQKKTITVNHFQELTFPKGMKDKKQMIRKGEKEKTKDRECKKYYKNDKMDKNAFNQQFPNPFPNYYGMPIVSPQGMYYGIQPSIQGMYYGIQPSQGMYYGIEPSIQWMFYGMQPSIQGMYYGIEPPQGKNKHFPHQKQQEVPSPKKNIPNHQHNRHNHFSPPARKEDIPNVVIKRRKHPNTD